MWFIVVHVRTSQAEDSHDKGHDHQKGMQPQSYHSWEALASQVFDCVSLDHVVQFDVLHRNKSVTATSAGVNGECIEFHWCNKAESHWVTQEPWTYSELVSDSYFFNAWKKVTKLEGARATDMQKSTANMKRATCADMESASGKMLPPYLIFKGKLNDQS